MVAAGEGESLFFYCVATGSFLCSSEWYDTVHLLAVLIKLNGLQGKKDMKLGNSHIREDIQKVSGGSRYNHILLCTHTKFS